MAPTRRIPSAFGEVWAVPRRSARLLTSKSRVPSSVPSRNAKRARSAHNYAVAAAEPVAQEGERFAEFGGVVEVQLRSVEGHVVPRSGDGALSARVGQVVRTGAGFDDVPGDAIHGPIADHGRREDLRDGGNAQPTPDAPTADAPHTGRPTPAPHATASSRSSVSNTRTGHGIHAPIWRIGSWIHPMPLMTAQPSSCRR